MFPTAELTAYHKPLTSWSSFYSAASFSSQYKIPILQYILPLRCYYFFLGLNDQRTIAFTFNDLQVISTKIKI